MKNTVQLLKIMKQEHRMMFYTLLATQLRAGLVPARALAELERMTRLPSQMRALAKAGSQAAREGRAEIDGMADSGLLPPGEIAVLRIADRYDQLQEAFDELVERREEDQGFLVKVIAPNAYFLMVASVATMFIWQAEDFLADLQVFGSGPNSLMDLSAVMKVWLAPVLAGCAGLCALIFAGMRTWTGPVRRILWVFDTQARLRFGILFTDLAAMMSRRGAADIEILETLSSVHGDSRYLRFHARKALEALQGKGAPWEDVLGRGLLLPEHAELLRGLVPGSDLRRYPEGYRSIGQVQRVILDQLYGRMQAVLRIALLLLIFWLLISMIQGMYSIMGSTQSIGF